MKLFNRAGRKARLGLFLCLAAMCAWPCVRVWAGETGGAAESGFFVFTEEQAAETYKNVYVFFSDVYLTGRVEGGVYAFFSTVWLQGADGGLVRLNTLSSKVLWDGNAPEIKHILGGLFAVNGEEEGVNYISDALPLYALLLAYDILVTLICLILYGSFRGFVKQGGVTLTAEPLRVLRNGMIAYFLCVSLMVVCALSLILLPITALILGVMLFIVFTGQASLALLAGMSALRQAGKTARASLCLLLGLAAFSAITLVPVLNIAVNLMFLPILSCGVTVTCAVNGMFKKRFYYTPFKSGKELKERRAFDREALRASITGGESIDETKGLIS